jgi:hypothetical protein
VAGDRLDSSDNLFVWHILGSANETGVFAIEEQGKAAIRISPKGSDQLAAFGLSKRTEVHSRILLNEQNGRRFENHRLGPGVGDARKVKTTESEEGRTLIERWVVVVPRAMGDWSNNSKNEEVWGMARSRQSDRPFARPSTLL